MELQIVAFENESLSSQQQLCTMLGFGRTLSLLFGEPAQGHDSERLTSLEETTSSGYPRNFILQRQGTVVVQVPRGYSWVCARCGTM